MADPHETPPHQKGKEGKENTDPNSNSNPTTTMTMMTTTTTTTMKTTTSNLLTSRPSNTRSPSRDPPPPPPPIYKILPRPNFNSSSSVQYTIPEEEEEEDDKLSEGQGHGGQGQGEGEGEGEGGSRRRGPIQPPSQSQSQSQSQPKPHPEHPFQTNLPSTSTTSSTTTTTTSKTTPSPTSPPKEIERETILPPSNPNPIPNPPHEKTISNPISNPKPKPSKKRPQYIPLPGGLSYSLSTPLQGDIGIQGMKKNQRKRMVSLAGYGGGHAVFARRVSSPPSVSPTSASFAVVDSGKQAPNADSRSKSRGRPRGRHGGGFLGSGHGNGGSVRGGGVGYLLNGRGGGAAGGGGGSFAMGVGDVSSSSSSVSAPKEPAAMRNSSSQSMVESSSKGGIGEGKEVVSFSSSSSIPVSQTRNMISTSTSTFPIPVHLPARSPLIPPPQPLHNAGTSQTWVSPMEYMKTQYTRLATAALHHGFLLSPYFPKTHQDYIRHCASYLSSLAEIKKGVLEIKVWEKGWEGRCKREGKEERFWKVGKLERGVLRGEGFGDNDVTGRGSVVLGLGTGVWRSVGDVIGVGVGEEEEGDGCMWPDICELKAVGGKGRLPYPRLGRYRGERIEVLMEGVVDKTEEEWEERMGEVLGREGKDIEWWERELYVYEGGLDRLDLFDMMRGEEEVRVRREEEKRFGVMGVKAEWKVFEDGAEVGGFEIFARDEREGVSGFGGGLQPKPEFGGFYGEENGVVLLPVMGHGLNSSHPTRNTFMDPGGFEHQAKDGGQYFFGSGYGMPTAPEPRGPNLPSSHPGSRGGGLARGLGGRGGFHGSPARVAPGSLGMMNNPLRPNRNQRRRNSLIERNKTMVSIDQERVAFGAAGLGDGEECVDGGWVFDEWHLKERGWGDFLDGLCG